MNVNGEIHAPAALNPEKELPLPISWVGLRASTNSVDNRIISCPFWELKSDYSIFSPLANIAYQFGGQ
jgi:hypothetical protein